MTLSKALHLYLRIDGLPGLESSGRVEGVVAFAKDAGCEINAPVSSMTESERTSLERGKVIATPR